MKKILAAALCLGLMLSPAGAAPSFPSTNPPIYPSVHITSATTTLVLTGAGAVRVVCVGTPVAAGTITIYDALTAVAPVMTIITTPAAAGNPFCLPFNMGVQVGITVVTVGAQDVTVSYSN